MEVEFTFDGLGMILILVSLIGFCALGMFTCLDGIIEAFKQKRYIHKNTGNEYFTEKSCRIKFDGTWYDGITYIAKNGKRELCVRTKDNFHDKFTPKG